jgi:hypothetical protein
LVRPAFELGKRDPSSQTLTRLNPDQASFSDAISKVSIGRRVSSAARDDLSQIRSHMQLPEAIGPLVGIQTYRVARRRCQNEVECLRLRIGRNGQIKLCIGSEYNIGPGLAKTCRREEGHESEKYPDFH